MESPRICVEARKTRKIQCDFDFQRKTDTRCGGGTNEPRWFCKIALEQAGEAAKGAVLASDAFFPFGDTVETAAKHGIAAIIQPGGSIRDEESIKAADEAGIAMVFTSIRHFKH